MLNKKAPRQIARRKFQNKLVLVGTLCTVLAVIITALGLFEVSKASIDVLSHELLSNSVRQISLNIDDNIQQIQALVVNIQLDPEFDSALKNAATNAEPINSVYSRQLQSKLLQTQLMRRDINGIYVFDHYGKPLYSASSPSLKRTYDVRQEVWYDQLSSTATKLVLGSHVPDRYLEDQTEVVTVVQRLVNVSNNQPLATILVDVKLDMFDNIISTLEPSSSCVVLITDADGSLVYSNDGTNITDSIAGQIYASLQDVPQLQTHKEGSFTQPYENRMLNVNFTTSAATGWKIICYADGREVSRISENMRGNALLFVILAGLLSALCTFMLIRKQFRGLNQLKDGMGQVMEGDYNIRIPKVSDDEVGALCETFNAMTERLNYYINTVERLEWEKQESLLKTAKAELAALQAQINPHFIYNALETISMMAEINDDFEVSQMAASLGKLLYTSVKGASIVTVEEELAYTRNYLYIQQIRFADKFAVSFRIPPELYQYAIPKLTLQPLIENCIHHGLETKEDPGIIAITARRSGDDLVFEVHDNGVGMDERRLADVRQRLLDVDSSANEEKSSIGLANVHQRIRLYFRDDCYGVKIHSTQGQGTTITVRLPAVDRKEGLKNDSDDNTGR